MIPEASFDNLSAIERPLYGQLLVMAVLSAVIVWPLAGWDWALAASAGFIAALVFYKLLAVQVRRQFGARRQPPVITMVLCLVGRQLVCLMAPAACFFWLGQPWLACLLTLVIARHWIFLVTWQLNRPDPVAAQA